MEKLAVFLKAPDILRLDVELLYFPVKGLTSTTIRKDNAKRRRVRKRKGNCGKEATKALGKLIRPLH